MHFAIDEHKMLEYFTRVPVLHPSSHAIHSIIANAIPHSSYACICLVASLFFGQLCTLLIIRLNFWLFLCDYLNWAVLNWWLMLTIHEVLTRSRKVHALPSLHQWFDDIRAGAKLLPRRALCLLLTVLLLLLLLLCLCIECMMVST